MKHRRNLKWGAGLLLALCLAGSVPAVEIVHSIDGLKFSDTLENQDVDGTPPETADMTPGAGVGEEWIAGKIPGPANPVVAIETLASPATPGAHQGVQFAHLDNRDDLLEATFPFVAQGVLTVRFAAYFPSTVGSGSRRIIMRFIIGGDVPAQIEWNTAENKLIHKDGDNVRQDAGITFLRDQWQEYTVVYNYNETGAGAPDDDTVDITIDGVTVTGLDTGPAAANTSIDTVDWRLAQNDDAELFLDAHSDAVDFSLVSVQDAVALCFTSEADAVYTLQASPDSNNWANVGASIAGDGGVKCLLDPTESTGTSTSKVYRILSKGN